MPLELDDEDRELLGYGDHWKKVSEVMFDVREKVRQKDIERLKEYTRDNPDKVKATKERYNRERYARARELEGTRLCESCNTKLTHQELFISMSRTKCGNCKKENK